MTICLPPPAAASYRLVDELREPMGIAGVHRIAMDDLAVEQALLTKLGARGWGRIHHFRNHYHQPWGERGVAPVSPRALESLSHFVLRATFPHGQIPSVFLTDAGGLELCWEDTDGTARQVEFKPDAIEYFVGRSREEGSVGLDRVDFVVGKLSAA
jgi:hypothetical protein